MFKRKKKQQEETENLESEVLVEQEKQEELTESEIDKNKETEETLANEIIEETVSESSDVVEEKEVPEEAKQEEKIEESELVEVEQESKIVEDGKIEIKTTISTKNYDDAVVKLINEVKIFNDDADDLGFNKKRKVWPIILIIILLIGAAVGIYFFVEYQKEEEPAKESEETVNNNSNVTYRYEKTENGIEFFADNNALNIYECEDCSIYSLGVYEYFSTDPTVLAIQEGDNIFLYDYTLDKVVSEKYKELRNLKAGDKTVAFIVSDENGLYGIIDVRGSILVPLEYEELGFAIGGGEVSDYSYEDDKITAKKAGFWGVINFEGEVIVQFKYDDIFYNGYDAIAVNVEGYWYLTNFSNNRLIETGYDIIIPIKSYVFASVNNVFYVLNYKGESIITKEIPTYLDTFRNRESSITPAFKIKEEGTVVNIYIMNSDETYNEYKFNTVNGELTEIIQ